MINKKDIELQREQMQDDVMCILDGVEDYDRLAKLICEVIVDRCDILISKLKTK